MKLSDSRDLVVAPTSDAPIERHRWKSRRDKHIEDAIDLLDVEVIHRVAHQDILLLCKYRQRYHQASLRVRFDHQKTRSAFLSTHPPLQGSATQFAETCRCRPGEKCVR